MSQRKVLPALSKQTQSASVVAPFLAVLSATNPQQYEQPTAQHITWVQDTASVATRASYRNANDLVTVPESPSQTRSIYNHLDQRMVQMTLETKVWFTKIEADISNLADRLSRVVSALDGPFAQADSERGAVPYFLPESSEELVKAFGADYASVEWAEFLDRAVEEEAHAPYLADLAQRALSSSRASVRAAAARALALADDRVAAEMLPAAIRSEKNLAAASVMRAALAAARA